MERETANKTKNGTKSQVVFALTMSTRKARLMVIRTDPLKRGKKPDGGGIDPRNRHARGNANLGNEKLK